MGRPERLRALGWYAAGLLLCGERKSIAPIAARLRAKPQEAEAIRQRLQQAVVVAKWEPDVLFARLARQLNRELGDIDAQIGDDTTSASLVGLLADFLHALAAVGDGLKRVPDLQKPRQPLGWPPGERYNESDLPWVSSVGPQRGSALGRSRR